MPELEPRASRQRQSSRWWRRQQQIAARLSSTPYGTTLVLARDVDAPTRYDGGHVIWLKDKKGDKVSLVRGTVGSSGQCVTYWHYEHDAAKLDAETVLDCKDLELQ